MKHVFNFHFLMSIAFVLGGISIGALINWLLGFVSIAASAYYNIRKAYLQDKEAKEKERALLKTEKNNHDEKKGLYI